MQHACYVVSHISRQMAKANSVLMHAEERLLASGRRNGERAILTIRRNGTKHMMLTVSKSQNFFVCDCICTTGYDCKTSKGNLH